MSAAAGGRGLDSREKPDEPDDVAPTRDQVLDESEPLRRNRITRPLGAADAQLPEPRPRRDPGDVGHRPDGGELVDRQADHDLVGARAFSMPAPPQPGSAAASGRRLAAIGPKSWRHAQ